MDKFFANIDREYRGLRHYKIWCYYIINAQSPSLTHFRDWIGRRPEPLDAFSRWLVNLDDFTLSFYERKIFRSCGMWVFDDGKGFRWSGDNNEVIECWKKFLIKRLNR